MTQKLRNIIITGNNNIEYNFIGEEAETVERLFRCAWERNTTHLVLPLKGRTIFLNMDHISEVYINYDEVNE